MTVSALIIIYITEFSGGISLLNWVAVDCYKVNGNKISFWSAHHQAAALRVVFYFSVVLPRKRIILILRLKATLYERPLNTAESLRKLSALTHSRELSRIPRFKFSAVVRCWSFSVILSIGTCRPRHFKQILFFE